MKINPKEFHKALSKINRVTPYLKLPGSPLIIDISYGKVRAANSVQFWQVKSESLPDMQLIKQKSDYLESLIENIDEIDFETTESHYIFKLDQMTIKLAKPVYLSYDNIEEIFLKPTLVNEFDLKVPVVELREALERINQGIKPRAVGMHIDSESVTLIGRDMYDNSIEYPIAGTFTGKNLDVAFPAPELLTLVSLLEDDITTFKLGLGTRTRPSALLAIDEKSGLTCVLSPMLL